MPSEYICAFYLPVHGEMMAGIHSPVLLQEAVTEEEPSGNVYPFSHVYKAVLLGAVPVTVTLLCTEGGGASQTTSEKCKV